MRTTLTTPVLAGIAIVLLAAPAVAKGNGSDGKPDDIPPAAVVWNPPSDDHGDHPSNGGNGVGHEQHGNGYGYGHDWDDDHNWPPMPDDGDGVSPTKPHGHGYGHQDHGNGNGYGHDKGNGKGHDYFD